MYSYFWSRNIHPLCRVLIRRLPGDQHHRLVKVVFAVRAENVRGSWSRLKPLLPAFTHYRKHCFPPVGAASAATAEMVRVWESPLEKSLQWQIGARFNWRGAVNPLQVQSSGSLNVDFLAQRVDPGPLFYDRY